MALWANSSLNTTAASMLLNQVFNRKAIAQIRKHNGLLFQVLGKTEMNTETGMPSWQRLSKITGDQIRVRLRGRNFSMTTVADGSAENAVVTPQYLSNMFGAALFDLTHYADTIALPHSELNRIAGDEAATVGYLSEISDALVDSYEDALGTAINGTAAPSRTAVGGWQGAVDDGNVLDSYGGISRLDSANSDFRGGVATGGALTPARIKTGQLAVRANNGKATVGVCADAVYAKVNSFIEGYTHIINDPTWNEFGGDFIAYSGTRFVYDQRATSGCLGLLDPTSFVCYSKDIAPATMMPNPSWVASDALRHETWFQLLCVQPNKNYKFLSLDV